MQEEYYSHNVLDIRHSLHETKFQFTVSMRYELGVYYGYTIHTWSINTIRSHKLPQHTT